MNMIIYHRGQNGINFIETETRMYRIKIQQNGITKDPLPSFVNSSNNFNYKLFVLSLRTTKSTRTAS